MRHPRETIDPSSASREDFPLSTSLIPRLCQGLDVDERCMYISIEQLLAYVSTYTGTLGESTSLKYTTDDKGRNKAEVRGE